MKKKRLQLSLKLDVESAQATFDPEKAAGQSSNSLRAKNEKKDDQLMNI